LVLQFVVPSLSEYKAPVSNADRGLLKSSGMKISQIVHSQKAKINSINTFDVQALVSNQLDVSLELLGRLASKF